MVEANEAIWNDSDEVAPMLMGAGCWSDMVDLVFLYLDLNFCFQMILEFFQQNKKSLEGLFWMGS